MITVLPDALLVNGRGLPKPESSATELAMMLHQQLIGEMTLFDRLDNSGGTRSCRCWRRRRKTPAQSAAWPRPGTRSETSRSQLTEIDYAEVLRERAGSGESATWDRILTALKEEQDQQEIRRRTGPPSRTCWGSLKIRNGWRNLRSASRTSARPAATTRSSSAGRCRADARPGQLRCRAQTRGPGFGTEQDGWCRRADVARHAVDAHHRSAAGSGRGRARAWTSPANCRRA